MDIAAVRIAVEHGGRAVAQTTVRCLHHRECGEHFLRADRQRRRNRLRGGRRSEDRDESENEGEQDVFFGFHVWLCCWFV